MKDVRHVVDEKDGWWRERIVNRCDCFKQTEKGGYIRVKKCYDKNICKNN